MRTDPDAALAIMQKQQAVEEWRTKQETDRLTRGEKVMDFLGRGAQGVTDQASLDAFRTQLQAIGLGQYASQLPQFYSKEAMARLQAQALDVKETLTLQVQDLQAQAAVIKARKEGRSVDVDNQLRAMGVQPGQETSEQIRDAIKAVEDAKVRVSAAHGSGQIKDTSAGTARINPRTGEVEYITGPQGEPVYPKPTAEEQKAATFGEIAGRGHAKAVELETKGFTPGFWERIGEKLPMGMGNYLQGEDYQKYYQAVNEFAQAWLRKTSGAAVQPSEWEMTERTYFPRPGDTKAVIEQKRAAREALIKDLEAEGKQTGRTRPQGQQAASTKGGKIRITDADIQETMKGSGKTREEVLEAFRQSGRYEVP
jgi:hypothetical protein